MVAPPVVPEIYAPTLWSMETQYDSLLLADVQIANTGKTAVSMEWLSGCGPDGAPNKTHVHV